MTFPKHPTSQILEIPSNRTKLNQFMMGEKGINVFGVQTQIKIIIKSTVESRYTGFRVNII